MELQENPTGTATVAAAVAAGNELGQILCRHCGSLLGTVPTNGYKKFYGSCADDRCSGEARSSRDE